MTGLGVDVIRTERLLVRPPHEVDRARFVELFCNAEFMVFYPSVLTEEEARARFDHTVEVCQGVAFSKQPVVEMSTGVVVGYTGVDYIDFEAKAWLEWGYRLSLGPARLSNSTERL